MAPVDSLVVREFVTRFEGRGGCELEVQGRPCPGSQHSVLCRATCVSMRTDVWVCAESKSELRDCLMQCFKASVAFSARSRMWRWKRAGGRWGRRP